MPVFISHRTADDAIAQRVYLRLTRVHSIPCYLDNMDLELKTSSVTSRVIERLKQCTNLLALVTENTKGSWWVPFEVGVAREAPRLITTFTNLAVNELPEYLNEWPVLRGDNAIDTFAKYYKIGSGIVKRAFVEHTLNASQGLSSIEAFYRNLKTELGQ